jgi:hypothetical protein
MEQQLLMGANLIMAQHKLPERSIELEPPLAGISENLAFEQKPPFTTPVCMNMRPYDPDKERARMGQRPGTVKAYETQIGGNYPVVKMVAISNTFIQPVVVVSSSSSSGGLPE